MVDGNETVFVMRALRNDEGGGRCGVEGRGGLQTSDLVPQMEQNGKAVVGTHNQHAPSCPGCNTRCFLRPKTFKNRIRKL
jgi:hypothetical protein